MVSRCVWYCDPPEVLKGDRLERVLTMLSFLAGFRMDLGLYMLHAAGRLTRTPVAIEIHD